MSIAEAMEAAVMAKVGHVQGELVPDEEPTYETLRELFGSNEEIATAAGYGKPGQHKQGTEAWRRRRTLMRNLQRYEQARTAGPGQKRRPVKILPRLQSIARAEQRKRATPSSVREVVRLMGHDGTTSVQMVAEFRYDTERGTRDIDARVYSHPSVYRSVGWPMRGQTPGSAPAWGELGDKYLEAFLIAYGMPGQLGSEGVESTPIFLFTIGREGDIDYEYR